MDSTLFLLLNVRTRRLSLGNDYYGRGRPDRLPWPLRSKPSLGRTADGTGWDGLARIATAACPGGRSDRNLKYDGLPSPACEKTVHNHASSFLAFQAGEMMTRGADAVRKLDRKKIQSQTKIKASFLPSFSARSLPRSFQLFMRIALKSPPSSSTDIRNTSQWEKWRRKSSTS